jgi:hypothetical protein
MFNATRGKQMTKNQWLIGAEVKVGFISGLHVHEKVASPGNYKPDGYILSRGNTLYAFIPHHGLTKCVSFEEAREVIKA